MRVAREEVSGPVVALTPVSGMDDAPTVLNESELGNAAGPFTGGGGETQQFRREAEAGILVVNA
jgi:acyl-CoA reductase-like NAD-dependent aldehyde dehydrogenase